MNDIKRIDIKEFRERGYLQEVNRQFLHPLGLALEVVVDDDGSETLGGVWDYRDDPEGMIFAAGTIEPEKAARISSEVEAKSRTRREKFGWVTQPVRSA